MASTSFAQLAPIARTAPRASDARTARPPTRGARAVTRAEAETAGSAIGPDSTEVRPMTTTNATTRKRTDDG